MWQNLVLHDFCLFIYIIWYISVHSTIVTLWKQLCSPCYVHKLIHTRQTEIWNALCQTLRFSLVWKGKKTCLVLHNCSWFFLEDYSHLMESLYIHGWFSFTDHWFVRRNPLSYLVSHHDLQFHLQLPAGAGFSWNADWPRAHHRFFHRGDARRHRRSHPRERFGGWPQEALQEVERIWKRFPEQVRHSSSPNMHTHLLELSNIFGGVF